MSVFRRGPTHRVAGVAAVVAGVLLGATGQAWGVAYTFTPIAEWGPGLGSINNEGTVAYVETLRDGTQRVVKTAMDGTTTVIADTTGPFSNFYFAHSIGTTPSINDQGVVGFVASRDAGGVGIYTGNGAALRLVEDGTISTLGYRPYLNAGGQVMYHKQYPSGDGGQIVVDTGGGKVVIAATDGTYSYVGGFGINSSGEVVFRRANGGVGSWFISDGSSEQEIGNFGATTYMWADISDYHAIFTGAAPGGNEAIYSYRNGSVTALVDTSGPLKSFREIATNNRGDLVFMAMPDEGNGYIFSSADLDTPVVSIGDPLLGSTITQLDMFPSLNDSGQFAFRAYLADSRQVLVRADLVPEPSSVVFVLMGLGALRYRRTG